MKPPCKGTLAYIDGKWWCIGEKMISKWKYSKFNKTNKNKNKNKNRRRKKTHTRKSRPGTKN